MMFVAGVCWLGTLVCWVMVLIKIFKDNVGLGILGIICQLFAFIYGWVKAAEYGVKKIMLYWTILLIGGMVLWFIGVGLAAASGAVGT